LHFLPIFGKLLPSLSPIVINKELSINKKHWFISVVRKLQLSTMFIGLLLLLAALPCTFAQSAAQEAAQSAEQEQKAWYAPLVFSAGMHYFFTPELFADKVQPSPGFRAGIGYDFGQFTAGLELGFTAASGIDPLAQSVRMIPMLVKFTYIPPLKLYGELGLRADLGAGLVLGSVDYYSNSIALWQNKEQSSSDQSLLAEARLYLTHPLPANFGLYAGGGIDLFFENEASIIMPVLQAGVTFKPFVKARKTPPAPIIAQEVEPELVVEVEDELEAEPEVPAERKLAAVYFAPNSMVMLAQYVSALDEAAAYLAEYPTIRITLRGYAALFGTAGGRQMVSEGRAQYVKDYLMRTYGISEDRITVEFFGADKVPELADGSWETYRAVELIIGEIEQIEQADQNDQIDQVEDEELEFIGANELPNENELNEEGVNDEEGV